jgi:hypothetical protein
VCPSTNNRQFVPWTRLNLGWDETNGLYSGVPAYAHLWLEVVQYSNIYYTAFSAEAQYGIASMCSACDDSTKSWILVVYLRANNLVVHPALLDGPVAYRMMILLLRVVSTVRAPFTIIISTVPSTHTIKT